MREKSKLSEFTKFFNSMKEAHRIERENKEKENLQLNSTSI